MVHSTTTNTTIRMLRFIIVIILTILGKLVAFPQDMEHEAGGHFTKKMEYNVAIQGETEADNRYNLDGKSTLDRIFFGETNSLVDYVFQPSSEKCNEATGLRIVKTPNDSSFRLEIMLLPNCQDLLRRLEKNTAIVVFPDELKISRMISPENIQLINEYNQKMGYSRYTGEVYKPYHPEPKTFCISNQLTETFYGKMVSLIENFNAEGIPKLASGGYRVTFRCVVGAEVWSLNIHMPQKKALQLSDLCRQIIADGIAGKFDEAKYIERLNQIM